jgi:hypothetical protein
VAALGIAAAVTLFAAGAVAQPATQAASLRVVGIVEVPRLFFHYSRDGAEVRPDPSATIRLRAEPSPAAALALTVRPGELVEREHGYEAAGALAYGRERGWTLVKTAGGAGWLAPEDSGAFHPIESLFEDSHSYLTDAWDGSLSAAPGGVRSRVPDDPLRRVVGHIEPLQSGRADRGAPVRLFERPDAGAPVVGETTLGRIDEALASYDAPAHVVVTDVQPGWYQTALDNHGDWRRAKRVWLQASPFWRFFAIKDESDGRDKAFRAWGPEEFSVTVVGFARVDGVLWANVRLFTESECSTPPEVKPAVRATGWMPVHAPSGEPAIWFHSRGC